MNDAQTLVIIPHVHTHRIFNYCNKLTNTHNSEWETQHRKLNLVCDEQFFLEIEHHVCMKRVTALCMELFFVCALVCCTVFASLFYSLILELIWLDWKWNWMYLIIRRFWLIFLRMTFKTIDSFIFYSSTMNESNILDDSLICL